VLHGRLRVLSFQTEDAIPGRFERRPTRHPTGVVGPQGYGGLGPNYVLEGSPHYPLGRTEVPGGARNSAASLFVSDHAVTEGEEYSCRSESSWASW